MDTTSDLKKRLSDIDMLWVPSFNWKRKENFFQWVKKSRRNVKQNVPNATGGRQAFKALSTKLLFAPARGVCIVNKIPERLTLNVWLVHMAAWESVKVNTKISQEQTQNSTVPFFCELRAIAFVFMIIICFQIKFAVCAEKGRGNSCLWFYDLDSRNFTTTTPSIMRIDPLSG